MVAIDKKAESPVSRQVEGRSAATIIELAALASGDRGTVASVLGDGRAAMRLKALGICEGRQVQVLRTGAAWVVRVGASRIGIARELVGSVMMSAA